MWRLYLIIVLVLIAVVSIKVILHTTSTQAAPPSQATNTFEIRLPSAPTGVSGAIIEVTVLPGIVSTYGDFNCNNNRDFADAVALFEDISSIQPLTDCRQAGNVATLTNITFPDFGLTQTLDLTPTSARFSFTDLSRLIEVDATDSLLATIHYTSSTTGVAPYIITFERLDDDNGNTIPEPPQVQLLVN